MSFLNKCQKLCFTLPCVIVAVSCCPLLTFAQTLLFKSGFENNFALGSLGSAVGPNGFTQTTTGTDLSTGWTWPITAYGSTNQGIHLEPASGYTDLDSNHFLNSIDTLTGHTGASTKTLHLFLTGYTGCCAQQTLELAGFSTPIKSEYFRVWYFLPSATQTQFANTPGMFRMMWEFKTNNNARMASSINKGGPTGTDWEVQFDDSGRTGNDQYINPNTGSIDSLGQGNPMVYYDSSNTALAVPFGQWFLQEIYLKRSVGNDGRYYMAINGQTVFDHLGPNYGYTNEEISNNFIINEYGSSPAEEWLDDLEIWDAPPCATLPCGPSGTGSSSTNPQPPFLTNPFGVIGTVGVPFSYQLTGTNSPSSYVTSVPAGLSLNSSTGLISGTPTTAGNSLFNVRLTNGAGNTDKAMVFTINSPPTSAPTISSFTAVQPTITAGQWSQLQWAQSGAATLTLNPGNINVNGQDPFPVSPAVTTTYTLTATNSSGSGTRTATVTVIGNPVISSFAANPAPVTPGASTTLSWTTSGATSLSLNPGAINVTGTTSRVVTPAVNTTYTLTATNANGSVSSSVTVFLAIRRVGQEAGIQFSNPPTNPFCQYGEYQRAPASGFLGNCSNFLKMYDIFPSIYNPDQSNQSIPLSLVNQYAIKVIWTDNNTYNGYGAYLGDSTGLNIADVNFQNYYWGNYTPNVTVANFQTKTGTTVTPSNPLYISADAWFEPYSTWGADVNGVRQTPVVWAAGYPQNATAWSLGWQAFITAAKNQAPNIRLSPHIATQDPIAWTNWHTIYADCPAIEKEHLPLTGLNSPIQDANHRLQVYQAIINFYWFANIATPVFPNIANEPPTRVTQWGLDIDQTVSADVHTALGMYALSRGTNSFFDLIHCPIPIPPATGCPNITADPTLWLPTATLLGIVNNAGPPTATVIATGHVLTDGFNLMVRTYPGGIAYYNMTGTVQHPVPPPGAKDWVGNPVTSLTLADGQGEVLLTAAVPGPTRISGAILHAISVH